MNDLRLSVDIILIIELFAFNTPQNHDFSNAPGLFWYFFLADDPHAVTDFYIYFMSIYISFKLNYWFNGFWRKFDNFLLFRFRSIRIKIKMAL